MSTHTDEDEDLSQEEEEEEDNHDMYQQDDDEGDYDDQQQNAFVTDDADVQLSDEQQQLGDFEDIEPIEARPPNEIDVDEQERHQSGTPAFRTLDDV